MGVKFQSSSFDVGGKKYIVVVSEGLLERMGEERKWESAKQKQSESACVSVSKVTGRTGQSLSHGIV